MDPAVVGITVLYFIAVIVIGYYSRARMKSTTIAGMPIATSISFKKVSPTSFADYYADRYNDQNLRWIIGIVMITGAILALRFATMPYTLVRLFTTMT